MLPNLNVLLKYQNTNVLRRYLRDYPESKLSPEEALTELLKFFWLSLKHEYDKQHFPHNKQLKFICGMHHEMKEIDNMWHTFLLFTKEYIHFCKNHLGRYFHHTPNTDNELMTDEEFKLDFTKFLSYVYDNLGEKTLTIWFNPLLNNSTPAYNSS